MTSKEPSSNLVHIRYSSEHVHLSAQLLIWAFPGVWGPLSEQQKHQREHRNAHVGLTWHSSKHPAFGMGYAEGLKAGETFVINFLFSRTSQGTSDISWEKMLIGLGVSWRRQKLQWKLLDLLLLARQMESQQDSQLPDNRSNQTENSQKGRWLAATTPLLPFFPIALTFLFCL